MRHCGKSIAPLASPRCSAAGPDLLPHSMHSYLQVLVMRCLAEADVLILGIGASHSLEPFAQGKLFHGCTTKATRLKIHIKQTMPRMRCTFQSRCLTRSKQAESRCGQVGECGAAVQDSSIPLVKQCLWALGGR